MIVCSLLMSLALVFQWQSDFSILPATWREMSFFAVTTSSLSQINVCIVKYGHFGSPLWSPGERLMFQLNGHSKDYQKISTNFKWPRGEEACFTNCTFVLSLHLVPLICIFSAPYDLKSDNTMPLTSMWPASNDLYLVF